MTEVDRLRVVYELMDGQFRAGMDRMRRLSDRTSRDILNSAGKAERSFQGMALKATAAAASIAALGASLAKLNKYTDSYRTIENRLRSIGEASDEAAEKLLAVAIRSRSPIEELSTSVARMQKATGDGFEVTLRRAETLNKLLAVGGATAQEVSSVMTQLSQALTSGTLQGDELRSLREAAPVEVLDAIAQAAGVTRGELKKMGEEGALTTEIITKALDNLAETADRKFGQTAQTAGQALTNISSAMTVFVGRLDEGLGASDRLIVSLNDLSAWLTENIAEAEQFGQSVSAAIETASQYADELRGYLEQIGVLTEAAFNPDAAVSFGEEIRSIIEFIAEMNGVIEGAAAVAREAFFSIADSIAEGMSDAINSVISAVETMINRVLDGVRVVAGVVDSLTAAAARANNIIPEFIRPSGLRTEGTDLAGSVGSVDFGRVELGPRLSSGESFGEIYQGVKEAGRNGILDGIDEAVSGYGGNLARRQIASQTPLSLDPEGLFPESPATATSGGGGGGSSGGGSKGRKGRKGSSGKTESPFFEDVQRDILALERQIELVGKSNEEIATAKARWELLDEAKKRGLTVNDELNAKIEQQASEVGRLTGELERAEIAQEQFDQAVDGIADAMAGALVAGEDLREGLANVFKGIASDLIRSGIQKLLLNLIPGLAGGGGGGGIKLPSFDGGGFTGYGSRSGGIDGKGGMPAILHPNETVVDHTKGQSMGAQDVHVTVSVDNNGNLQAFVDQRAGAKMQQGIGAYDKALPGRVQQINAHPRKR